MYLKFQIKLPVFLETIILYFLLRHRKKHHGFPFRKIKLIRADRKAKPVYAKVDPEDYLKLSQCDWQLIENKSKNSYAVRYDDEGKYIKMHRIIMNAPKGSIVDHIDHDGLNNIKQNLRFATPSQNSCNCRRPKNCNSKYRGVCFHKHIKKFRVEIRYNRIRKHIGYFDNEEDAARAYDQAAMLYHGEFAVLNFPQDNRAPNVNEGYLVGVRPRLRGLVGFASKIIGAAMTFLGKLLVRFRLKVIKSNERISPRTCAGGRPRLRGLICKLLVRFRLKVIKSNELV